MLTLETAQITQGSFTLHADLTLAPAQTYAVIGPSGAGNPPCWGRFAGSFRSGPVGCCGRARTSPKPPPVRDR